MIDAQLIERGGEAGVRLSRLIELVPAGGELGGDGMPLRPFHKSPTDPERHDGSQTDPADQAPLAQKSDHGASSISAARW